MTIYRHPKTGDRAEIHPVFQAPGFNVEVYKYRGRRPVRTRMVRMRSEALDWIEGMGFDTRRYPLFAMVHGDFHIWTGSDSVMLSNEATKDLRSFAHPDDVINWLYVQGHLEASRALHEHVKAKRGTK